MPSLLRCAAVLLMAPLLASPVAAQVVIHDIQPAPGAAQEFYQASRRIGSATASDLERRLALLDSAVARSQGNDRILYGYHRGSIAVGYARLLHQAMRAQLTCETAHRAATAWRRVPAAFGSALGVGDAEVEHLVEIEAPSSLEQAGGNERRLCPRSHFDAQRLPAQALRPGRAADYYATLVNERVATGDLAGFRRRLSLLDSAVQFSEGYDRAWYAYRRGQENSVFGGMLNAQAARDGSCESARTAALHWSRAAAAWEGGRGINPHDYDFQVEQLIPVNLQRAEARIGPACDPGQRPPEVTAVAPGAPGTIRRLAGERRQLRPAIHAGRVAWNEQGERIQTVREMYDNMHLALHSLATGQTRILTRDTATVRDQIALSDRAVAWVSAVRGGWGLFVMQDGETRARQVAPGRAQTAPAFSGERLVWLEERAPAPGRPAVATVMLREGVRIRPLSQPADGPAGEPDISGRRVAWTVGERTAARVAVHDLATGTTRTLPHEPATRRAPRISGDRMVWIETRGQVNVVVVHDLLAGASRVITPAAARPNWAHISGDWVVYVDSRAGGANIYRFDLATGEEQRLTAHRPGTGDASLWGTRVVWWEGDDIFLYEESADLAPFQRLVSELDRLPADIADVLQPLLHQAAASLEVGGRETAAARLRTMNGYLGRTAPAPEVAAAIQAAIETVTGR